MQRNKGLDTPNLYESGMYDDQTDGQGGYDKIIFETPFEKDDCLIDLAKSAMENTYPLKIPLKVNFGTGENWAQAH